MDKGLVGRPSNPSGVAQATNDHSQCRVYGLIRVLPHECLSRGALIPRSDHRHPTAGTEHKYCKQRDGSYSSHAFFVRSRLTR